MGANNASAQSLLKQDYKEECDLKEACGLAVKVLSKTMDSMKLSSEKSKSSACCLHYRIVRGRLTKNFQLSLPLWERRKMGKFITTFGAQMRLLLCLKNTD